MRSTPDSAAALTDSRFIPPEASVMAFPLHSSTVSSHKETRILWNGPKTYLIISEKEEFIIRIIDVLRKAVKTCTRKSKAIN